LGLQDLETMPFCMATLFNFQNRLNDHFIRFLLKLSGYN